MSVIWICQSSDENWKFNRRDRSTRRMARNIVWKYRVSEWRDEIADVRNVCVLQNLSTSFGFIGNWFGWFGLKNETMTTNRRREMQFRFLDWNSVQHEFAYRLTVLSVVYSGRHKKFLYLFSLHPIVCWSEMVSKRRMRHKSRRPDFAV